MFELVIVGKLLSIASVLTFESKFTLEVFFEIEMFFTILVGVVARVKVNPSPLLLGREVMFMSPVAGILKLPSAPHVVVTSAKPLLGAVFAKVMFVALGEHAPLRE